ncbi:hypothetical protein [Leptolyngbya sp. FACHB-711]|uniref:hypothetical protein n=1 Tax=unclassified Leptolyngbya TaxID=2650499 RepID=UPI001681C8F4|nr:hypothetical protein [Leptolyngbya sp. FACHB-711]MBD1848476.1 hypothetical protein [Cyanobacteria bacterium FACHB-502]MBD2024958.1 hypothetical protein [Leptolyngbya sp. FACHB-711]
MKYSFFYGLAATVTLLTVSCQSPLLQQASQQQVGAVALATSPAQPSSATCDLTSSIYRDVGNGGFELEFSSADRSLSGGNVASATLKYPNGSILYTFSLTQAQGYGTVSLIQAGGRDSFTVNFFNADLTPASWASWRRSATPTYLFISGLGTAQYYRERNQVGETVPLLGDVMWKFDRCKS